MKEFLEYLSSLSNEERLEKIHVYLLLRSIFDQWKLKRRAELWQTLENYRVRCTFMGFPSPEKSEYNEPFFALGLSNKKLEIILELLNDYALPELSDRQFIALVNSEDGKSYFAAIPNGLQDELAQDNYAEVERILLEQIKKCIDPQKRN